MDSRTLSIIIAATDKASDVFKSVQSRMGHVSDALRRTGEKMQAMGKDLTKRVTLPIIGLGVAAAKAFMDFDDAMTQSLAIMGDVSADMRKEMEMTARTLAKETSVSAKEAAESYFFLASAGMDAEQSIAALPQVAKFAQAGMFDMARATDLATDAQSALGLTAKDAQDNLNNLTRVTDVLVGANTLANASVEQFSEALTTRAGAALRLVNKDVEEGVAVLAAWADQGVKGAEAGNRLDIVLRDLQNAAIKNSGEFDRMNIKVFDAEGNIRNLAAIIADMEGAFEGMSDKQLRASLSTLGFTDRSIAATASLLGMSDQIAEYEKGLRGMAGITDEVASKQLESFKQQMELAKARMTEAAIVIGDKLAPHILRLAELVAGAVQSFGEMSEGQQNAILIIGGVVAAIGPLLFVLGALVKAAATVKVGILAIGTASTAMATASTAAFGATKTSFLALKALVAVPMVMPAIAVGAALAAIALVVKKYFEMKATIEETEKAVKANQKSIDNALQQYNRQWKEGKITTERYKQLINQYGGHSGGGFADGGFTGRGGKNEIAGLVHRGEFVVPKENVDQSTGKPKMGNTFNFYGNIELGDRGSVDRFFERLDRQATLADNGIGV